MALRFDEAAGTLGVPGSILQKIPEEVKEQAQEIRLRCGRPVTVCTGRRTWFLTGSGALLPQDSDLCPVSGPGEMKELFRGLCAYSLYSHEREIRQGYLTLRGGHRVGLCGTAVMQNGEIVSVGEISSLCVRICRELPGAADELFRRIGLPEGGLLIAGAPSSGKTTVLRDIARQLAGGKLGRYYRVAVVDERGELGSSVQGQPQNDLGISCDLLSGYPRAEGILQAMRVLSPEYVLCDELGSEGDAQAVEAGMFAGAGMIASIHAGSRRELLSRPLCRRMLETGAFSRVVLLSGRESPGKIAEVMKAGDLLHEADGTFTAGSSLRWNRADTSP